MRHSTLFRACALTALALCCVVVVLGAYTRLTNSGLGCPDWPGCYGHLTPTAALAADATTATGQPINVTEAWHEMVHRYAAGTLGLLIAALAVMAVAWRRERIASPRFTLSLLGLVLVQAVLGMLTVTLQLKPIIVTAHLLFGFTTLAMLWWLVLTLGFRRTGAWAGVATRSRAPLARRLALLALCVLGVQIFLGGWTSSNYAAFACPDFPTCQGSWWPHANFHSAFVLWRDLHVDYQGGILSNPARVAIHLTHRIGALVTTLVMLVTAGVALRRRAEPWARPAALFVLIALATQLTIGIWMVLQAFPLWLATAHNAGAALLLLATVALNRALRPVRPAVRPV